MCVFRPSSLPGNRADHPTSPQRLDHPLTTAHTKALAGVPVPGDDSVARHPKLQFTAMARQEHKARHLRLSFLLACIFSIASSIPSRR